MRVYVKVDGEGREIFPLRRVRTKEDLGRILAFARIGSQKGSPRDVFRIDSKGEHLRIARYEGGQSRTTRVMRARRSPLWGIGKAVVRAGLERLLER